MRRNSVVVGLFNENQVLDRFCPEEFVAEYEEEYYYFRVQDNDLGIYHVDENRNEQLVKVYAMGRWAQVEYI